MYGEELSAMDTLPQEFGDFICHPEKSNTLKIWGNQLSMNLNHMILSNVQQSPYFKEGLCEMNTFHELIDEIYYKVAHLEPWERGSRRMGPQTGMCGGVRGVGAGGIVSTPFCLLYKLFNLKLTRKQLQSMLDHRDSPYIRAIGFMYIRYCLDPKTFLDWYEPYLEDEEEIDVKAGGGCGMTIGNMIHQWLVKLDWYGTLFPRIPVPVQKSIDAKLKALRFKRSADRNPNCMASFDGQNEQEDGDYEVEPVRTKFRPTEDSHSGSKREHRSSGHHHKKHRHRSRSAKREHSGDRRRRARSRSSERRPRHHYHNSSHRDRDPEGSGRR